MRLATKFNIIFTAAFTLGLASASLVSYTQLQENARSQVIANARLMLQTALAMRAYTTDQIQPMVKENWKILDDYFVKVHINLQQLVENAPNDKSDDFRDVTARILDTGKSKLKEVNDTVFFPQAVPAFAATESFQYLRKEYPQYQYKEAALNPTNPRDLAIEWEQEVINSFRNDGSLTEWIGERNVDGDRLLYLGQPIKIKSEACLTCHSVPEAAPVAMVKRYGAANGYGWKMGETIGAQFVSVPTSLPHSMASRAFETLMISIGAVFVVVLIVLNFVLNKTVIKPVRSLSGVADEVSKGDLTIPEVPVKGNDEISLLSASFNRMRRSMEKALKMLE